MLKGTTWQFNATLEFGTNPPPTGTQLSNENGLFTCDSVAYNEIRFNVQLGSTTIESISYVTADSQSVTVYTVSTSTWANNKYKTIAFINELDTMEETAETQFVKWLKTHAVKTADTNEYLVTGTDLISVANAIRNKSGDTYAFDFPSIYSASVANLVTATDLELLKDIQTTTTTLTAQTVPVNGIMNVQFTFSLPHTPVGKCFFTSTGAMPYSGLIITNSSYTKNNRTVTRYDVYRNITASPINVKAITVGKEITYYYEVGG